MNFTDAAAVESKRRTADGYLVADARIVRTGIQNYTGAEVGKPEMSVVRVYRPETEVFSHDSIASFSHVPITNDHPSVAVTADNWKDLAVGETSGEVLRDGHRLRIPLIVKDAAAIRDVEAGKRELSAGYTCDLAFENGTTADGQVYDAVQKNIRANHVAIVARGRAGAECRIGDSAGGSWGVSPIIITDKDSTMTLKTVTVDGIPIEVTDQGATVIATLQTRLGDATAKIDTLTNDHATALAAKDADLAKRDAAIDDLKAKVLSDADIDKRVQARADLIATSNKIAKDVATIGLSDAAIRKGVVTAKLGDAAVKDKADAYIDARFDILAEEVGKDRDGVRDALMSQDRQATLTDADTAYRAMLDRDRNAWQSAGNKEA